MMVEKICQVCKSKYFVKPYRKDETKYCSQICNGKGNIGNKRRLRHGMKGTRFYVIWRSAIQRCYYPSHKNYKNYGGRGIRLHKRWLKFENFRDDMYKSYLIHVKRFGEKNTQIDRIRVNGNYYKDNCRWVTLKEQAANKR